MTTVKHYRGTTLQILGTLEGAEPFTVASTLTASLEFDARDPIALGIEITGDLTFRLHASVADQADWRFKSRGLVRITRTEAGAGIGGEDFVHPPIEFYLEVNA